MTCPGAGESYEAVAVTVAESATVISWTADWQAYDSGDGAGPYAGQPCSDFPLLAGETTYKHIQTSRNQTANHRCVPMTKPIHANGP